MARAELSAPDTLLPAELSGDLAGFSPFELLQYLCSLGKEGELFLVRSDGIRAECRLGGGCVTRAELGHLRDREAVLAFVWWRGGAFRFLRGRGTDPAARRHRLEEWLMEAVRLADELELRQAHLPLPEAPLAITAFAAGEDELRCGVEEVFDFLRRHPGATRTEVEDQVPLAPIKVRLALAQLAHAGRISGAVSGTGAAATTGGGPPWWEQLMRRFPGGVRVLVAYSPLEATHEVLGAISRLGEALDLPSPRVAVSPEGPSFVRLRPPTGGILSLTFLPISRKNRYLFETFARSVQIAFVARADGGDHDWRAIVPAGVLLIELEQACSLEREIPTKLRDFAQAASSACATVP